MRTPPDGHNFHIAALTEPTTLPRRTRSVPVPGQDAFVSPGSDLRSPARRGRTARKPGAAAAASGHGRAARGGLSRRPASRPGARRPGRPTWPVAFEIEPHPGWRGSVPEPRLERFGRAWLILAARKPTSSRKHPVTQTRAARARGFGHIQLVRKPLTCDVQVLDFPVLLPSAEVRQRAISSPRGLYAGGQLHAVKITVRSSVNVSIGYRPPTRPMPLAVPAPPPNGRWLSQWLVVTLMLTMPLRTFSA